MSSYEGEDFRFFGGVSRRSLFQYGLRQSGHCTGGSCCRGVHLCPQRLHSLRFITLTIGHNHSVREGNFGVCREGHVGRHSRSVGQRRTSCLRSPSQRPFPGIPPCQHPGQDQDGLRRSPDAGQPLAHQRPRYAEVISNHAQRIPPSPPGEKIREKRRRRHAAPTIHRLHCQSLRV